MQNSAINCMKIEQNCENALTFVTWEVSFRSPSSLRKRTLPGCVILPRLPCYNAFLVTTDDRVHGLAVKWKITMPFKGIAADLADVLIHEPWISSIIGAFIYKRKYMYYKKTRYAENNLHVYYNAGEPGSSPGGGKDIFSRMRRPITWAGGAHVVRMGR
jgi:hypothetical protein